MLKYLSTTSLAHVYIPEFLNMELGRIIPAYPPGLNNCFMRSINKHSISELFSVNLSNNSKDSMPYFMVDLKAFTEYGGFAIKTSNCALSLLSSEEVCFSFPLYSLDFSKLSSPFARIIFASPSPFRNELTLADLTRR